MIASLRSTLNGDTVTAVMKATKPEGGTVGQLYLGELSEVLASGKF